MSIFYLICKDRMKKFCICDNCVPLVPSPVLMILLWYYGSCVRYRCSTRYCGRMLHRNRVTPTLELTVPTVMNRLRQVILLIFTASAALPH